MITSRTFEITFFILIYIYVLSPAATSFAGLDSDGVAGVTTPELPKRPICVYLISKKVHTVKDSGDRILANGLVECNGTADYCFSYWEAPVQGEEPRFLARGCFQNTPTCENTHCVAKEKRKNGSLFCCCRGSMCNQNVSVNFTIIATTPAPKNTNTAMSKGDPWSIVVYSLLGLLLLCFVICLVTMWWRRKRDAKLKDESGDLSLKKSATSPCIDLNNIQFLEMIGQGRYGSVYRAHLSGEEVAVKLFEQEHKSSFTNENYIYSLPLMEHQNLLSYLGGGEIFGPNANPCLGIVLSYCSGGKLSSFLQKNTIDWNAFIKMASSIVRGVTHLHSAIKKGDLFKPCVSHRDLKTSNILVRNDMSCVVSDLGFAIHTKNTVASLTDVGTYRYMAPEVLEGAVNLRECEYSLKQIDIYALGLVLWEVATRCHDFYQGMPTPGYKPPFQDEVGPYPAFERMQFFVVQKRRRPEFPSVWKMTNPFFRSLRTTMEECWDNDADARLTADCVANRLLDLHELWSRQNRMGSNPLNSAFNNPPPGAFTSIINELREGEEKKEESNEMSSLKQSNENVLGKNELAENVTRESPLQPHQGLNPCQERNRVSVTPENELKIQGNMLESSDCIDYQQSALGGLNNATLLELIETHPDIDHQLAREHLIPLLTNANGGVHPSIPNVSSTNSYSNERFYPHPILPKIPHLQNEVRVDVLAKRMNVDRPNEDSKEPYTDLEESNDKSKWPLRKKKFNFPHLNFFDRKV